MVQKFKKKTLFLAGMIGLSVLSLFGIRTNTEGNMLSQKDLKNLLTPTAHADVYSPAPYIDYPCPSAPCPGPGPSGPGPSGPGSE